MEPNGRTPLPLFPAYCRTDKLLKHKFNSVTKQSGPLGDPNCPPHVRKAKAVKRKIVKKTDGSTGSNCGRGGDESGNNSYGEELFENYNDNGNKNYNTLHNPPIVKQNIPMTVVIHSSLKDA